MVSLINIYYCRIPVTGVKRLGDGPLTCCWAPVVLGLMLSVVVRGWNVV